MSIALAIKTDRSVYVAGHVLKGTVTVHVDKKCEHGSPANDLRLQIQGKVTTRVIAPGDIKDSVGDPEELSFFQKDMVLASFRGVAKPGLHVLPFSAILPEGLPSTMMERCDDGGSAALSYHVKAKLDRPGLLRMDVKTDVMFTVVAAPPEINNGSEDMPLSVGPSTKIVKNVFERSIGSMTLAARLDNEAVRPGDTLSFTVVAQNDSSSGVLAMDLNITQLTTWVAHGRGGHKRRVIGSMLVPGHNLGELSKAFNRGNGGYGSGSLEDSTESAEASVYARLTSGTGSSILRFELCTPRRSIAPLSMPQQGSQLAYVPLRENFMESLDLGEVVESAGETSLQHQVRISHALELRLKTSSGSSCPAWSVPLKILPVAVPELLLLSLRSAQPLDTVPEVGHDAACLSISKLDELSEPESATSTDDASSCSS